MKAKIKALFITLRPWQIILLAVLGAVAITNTVTVLVSYRLWGRVDVELIVLGTINAVLAPVIIMPVIVRAIRRMIRLDEQNQFHRETILQLKRQKEVDAEIQRRADEMALLYQISLALSGGQDLYHALRAFVKELKRVMVVDAFHVGLYDEKTDVFSYKLFLNLDEDLQVPPRTLSKTPGLTWEVISTRRTLYLPDITDPEAQRQHNIFIVVDAGMHSYVGIPLLLQDRVIGVMSVQSVKMDAYSPDQLRVLETVAAQVATTIEKADLLEQLKQELEERTLVEQALQQSALRLELNHDIDRTLLSVQSLDQIANNALAGIRKLIPCSRASITLFDYDTKQAIILAINMDVGGPSPFGITIPFSEYGEYILETLRENQACFIDDLLTDPRATDWDRNLADEGFRIWLYLPLLYQGQLIGSLNLARGVGAPFTQADAELGYDVANPLAIAIRQARLTDALQVELGERKQVEADLRQRESILEAVTFAAEQFLKSPDWREHIDGVLEQLGKTIKATHAYLFEDHLNADGQPVTSMRYEWTAPGYPSDLDGPYFQNSLIHQEGFEEQVEKLKRGEARTGTSSTFNPVEKRAMDDLGVKAILEMPVFVNGKEWGAIGFDDFESEREWTAAEMDALRIAVGVLSETVQRQEAESAVRESERIYRQAIEAAGAVPYYRDYVKDRYTFMGEGIERIIGYKPDEITPDLFREIIKEEIPMRESEGLNIIEAVKRLHTGVIKEWKSDIRLIARNGEARWLANSAIGLFDNQKSLYASVGILQDITERKLIEASLRQREAILEAVTFAAEQFLKTSDWRASIDLVLARLGITLHVTHAYLFEHHVGVDGVEYSSLRYEWTAPGAPSDFDNPFYQQPHPLSLDKDSTDYFLRQGDIFLGNLSTMPAVEKDRLEVLGVKAMAELPVFVEGKWWGTLGFDDFETEREWSITEVDALKIAVGILSAAIQRQETESAVRESERIYRQAIEAAGAVPYYRDYRENRYAFMGNEIERMIGYKPEEVTVELFQEIMLENIPLGEAENLHISEAVSWARTGRLKIWKSDMRLLARNGEERWISDSAVELFDEAEYSYASVGILQDVTDRKRTEANLRKRELMLEASTFAAEQFLKTPDWRGTINDVLARLGREFNASHAYLFEKHTGADGMVLNSLRYEWVAPGLRSDMDNPAYQNAPVNDVDFRHYYEILDSGEPFVGGTSYFREIESERIWMEATSIKAMLEMRIVVDGKQWGTIGFDEMVNEREWTPMEVDVIRVASSVLGAAIKRQRDEAALQSELDVRKKLIGELENKNSELERFTYTVSHDLKSPLVTINGFLGFLEQDVASGDTERMRRDMQRIYEAVKKMQSLLNELLELSRIGRMMNAPQSLPFDLLVRDALDIVQGRLEERKVTVHTQPDLPPVHGDKPRLVEVLQNLLDNAAKYMGDQSDPRIEIGYRGEEQGQAVFFVKDNGMGIAPEFHERIFGLFNKLDPKSEGTGVGLALVRRIIEVHGGRIWVESEVGRGSTFLFALPPSGNL